MSSVQAIMAGLNQRLTADTSAGSFYDDLAGRIYEMEVPQNQRDLPVCVVSVVSADSRRLFGGVIRDLVVEIELWGAIKDGADALGDTNRKLFDLLQASDLVVAGADRGVTLCIDEGGRAIEEPDAFYILSQWQIQATTI